MHPEKKRVIIRLALFYLFVILCFIFAAKQMYHIQVTRHEELLRKAQNLYSVVKKEQMKRGEILDYDGNKLVSNYFVKHIVFDPTIETNPEKRKEIASYLANLLPETTYTELLRRINLDVTTGKKLYYVVLARDIDYQRATEIEKKTRGMRLRGLTYKVVNRRHYPKGSMLVNLLGISYKNDEESTPVEGLEKELSSETSSIASKSKVEIGARGRVLAETREDGQEGRNVYLTIREPIQAILEEEIDRLYQETGSRAVYAAIADPFTGDILAVTQRPTFDPNDRKTMSNPLARANLIAGTPYEPGSVMKPFVVSMALDRGVIKPDTIIDTGFDKVWRHAGKPLRDTHIVGYATPLQVIQHSSNIGTAKIALMLGEQGVYDTLSSFGFGKSTGLLKKTESKGTLHPVRKWDKLTVTRVCIGHSMNATALQLLRAYCMLANGGYPLDLRLVDSFEDDIHGKVKEPYKVSRESVFKNPDTHKEVVRMLKSVTKAGGTSEKAAVRGFEVAGKTGTANKIVNGRYVVGKYFASFCGFIPADAPRIVVVITCDEPSGDKLYGGSTSGPAFARIAQRVLQYMDVPPDMTPEQWDQMMKDARKQSIADMKKRENDRRRSLGIAPLQ